MRPFFPSPTRRTAALQLLLPAGALGALGLFLGGACNSGDPTPGDRGEAAAASQSSSARAAQLLTPLRARYAALSAVDGLDASLERVEFGAATPGEASAGEPHTIVQMPGIASDPLRVTNTATGVGVSVSLDAATDVAPLLEDSLAFYPEALGGAHVIRKLLPHGAEDFVAFETRPEKEEVRYQLELTGAAGVRVLPNVVEVLDQNGAPRVRMRAPTYTDERGEHPATFAIEGCSVDRDPAPAWSRPFQHLEEDATCELVVGFAGASYPMLLDPQWGDAGLMFTDRTNHTATFLPNFTLLLVGGFDSTGAPLNSAEIMCPSEICPPTSTFTPTVGSLGQARGDHTEAILPPDGSMVSSVLIAGGHTTATSTTSLATAEVCTIPAFNCATVAMSTGRLRHSSTILNSNKVLIAGGDATTPSSAQVFDPATSTFSAPLTMAAKRVGHAAELLPSTGQVFIAGGLGGIGAVSTAEFFNPTTNVFSAITGSQLTSPRAFATATRLEDAAGTILVTGGTNGSNVYYKTADIFIPNGMGGGSFQQQPVFMAVNRAFHRATRLKGTGKVLLTGGFDGTNLLSNTEVFDQQTTAFTLDSTMTRARAFHTATQLLSGQALVTGGGYNPNTNTTLIAAAKSTEILRRSNGEACSVGGECVSGFCAGNGAAKVCCDEECSNICSSCRIDAVNSTPGHCHTVEDGLAVKPICATDPLNDKASIQTNLVCVGGEVTAGQSFACLAYACDGDECATGSCTGKADVCSPILGFCAAAGCKLKQDLGKTCDDDEQCLSGHCADGVCCNATCDGQCEACDDPGEDGKPLGICQQVIGDVRTKTLKGFPTMRDACFGAGQAECAGSCKSSRTVCDYPNVPCGTDSCANEETASMLTVGACTPDGKCTNETSSCGDFKCNADANACIEKCTSTNDCRLGRICKPDGTCATISEAQCADDHTAVDAAGNPTDCGAYHCKNNACLTRCESIDDCVSPKVCDASNACVDPPPDPAPPDGCSVGPAAGASNGFAAVAGALALGLAAARRSRKSARARRSETRVGGAS